MSKETPSKGLLTQLRSGPPLLFGRLGLTFFVVRVEVCPELCFGLSTVVGLIGL